MRGRALSIAHATRARVYLPLPDVPEDIRSAIHGVRERGLGSLALALIGLAGARMYHLLVYHAQGRDARRLRDGGA